MVQPSVADPREVDLAELCATGPAEVMLEEVEPREADPRNLTPAALRDVARENSPPGVEGQGAERELVGTVHLAATVEHFVLAVEGLMSCGE